MLHITRVGVFTALLVSAAASVQAQVSTFEELRFRLAAGARVTVLGADGQEVEGQLLQIAPGHLTIADNNGETRTWLRPRIQRLSAEHADPLGNGAFIGAAVGAAVGAIPQLRSGCSRNPGCSIGWIGSSLAGAVVGALVDKTRKSKGMLYEGGPIDAAVAAGPDGTGFQVRYRW